MNGGITKQRILRALAASALAAVLCCLPAVSALGGQKTYGDNTITGDLATGFGAGVGLTGTGIEVTGGLGQAMTVEASLANTTAESGYFSKIVDTPTASDFYEVFYTSFSVAWIGVNNPEGTEYVIELSTAGDFSAMCSSGTFTSSPATLAGLESDATYYSRIKAVYGDSDESAWLAIGSTCTAYSVPPTIFITTPANNTFINFLGGISGAIADDVGVSDVWLSLHDTTTDKYWSGDSWLSGAPLWLRAADGINVYVSSWSLTTNLPALTDGSDYTAVAKAKDVYNKWSTANSTSAFTYLDPVPGCGADSRNVSKGGKWDSLTIQGAVAQLPATLTADTCVVVRDTETYSEQVTVANFANNGYRLKIMADPAFISSAPVVNPPIASTAAFQVMNDSVSIQGINIVSTNTIPYGIVSSSASVYITSANVVSGGKINVAGVLLSSNSTVAYSTVTVQSATAIKITGPFNTVSYSTFTSNYINSGAVYLIGADSNTVANCYMWNDWSYGLQISDGADANTVMDSTVTGETTAGYALRIALSDLNTIERSYLANPTGNGVSFAIDSDYNEISQSTIAAAKIGLDIYRASGTAVLNSYIHASTAVYVGASTNTLIGESILEADAIKGSGLWLAGGSVNLTLSTCVVSGGAEGAAVFLDEFNSGGIIISTTIITGGAYGLNIATQSAGTYLEISSVTFSALSAGATAINFVNGYFDLDLYDIAFNSLNIDVNVNAAKLEAGSHINVTGDAGARAGEAYENDPGNYVFWSCQKIYSVGSGPWSDPATWETYWTPTACNAVNILAGHTVTLNTLDAVSSTATIYGTVAASRATSSSWTLVGGNLEVMPWGWLDYGTEASVIPDTYLAHIVLASGTYAGQYGLIVNNGGNFTVRGSTKTPYSFATESITTAQTYLKVYGSTSTDGWQAGDTITIGPTSGNGTTTTSSRTITSITAVGDSYTVNWSGGLLSQARTISSTSPIIVSNLTRNVLVRSSGTVVATVNGNSAYIKNLAQNATSFALTQGEFAYLGSAGVSGKYGIMFDGSLTHGSISSSTIRHGYFGIYLNSSQNNTLSGNNLYSNSNIDIYLWASSNNTLSGNNSYSNSYVGIYFENSQNNTLSGNNSYSNSNVGIYLYASSNNTLSGNNSYSNSNVGIYLNNSSNNNTLSGNNSYSNSGVGIYLYTSSNNNTLSGNNSYSNSSHGIYLANSFGSSYNNTLSGNNSYSNSGYGIYLVNSQNNTFAGGSLGYDGAGAGKPNTTAEIYYDGTGIKSLTLKGTRVNPSAGISTAGMNTAGTYLLSYNQDYSTGTVKVWGNYQVAGSTLTLDYATQLYTSTNTTPKLMRGTGHSITSVVTYDAAALSELITVTHAGGSVWKVEGSNSGLLGTLSCGPVSNCGFANPKVDFTLNVGATLNTDDMLDFVTIAASNDANIQKKLLFGPAASGYNNGRSKLEIADTGGLLLRGRTDGTANTLVDWLDASSTYYTFVDSGAFTAEFSSFTNMDGGGIQLSGNKGVALSSSTFDYLGFAAGTNTYLTLRDLTSTLGLSSVTFNLSRAQGANSAYNVRVEGADAGLNWNVKTAYGPLRGELYEHDPNNKVAWPDYTPPTAGIIDPGDDGYENALAAIYGTAADNVAVSAVQVNMKNLATNKYWEAGSWSGTGPMWYSADIHPSSWTYAAPAWEDGVNYQVEALAQDGSGNMSSPYDTSIFVYDAQYPVAFITQPAHLSIRRALASITGTAFDPAGAIAPNLKADVGRVEIQLYDQAAGMYWASGDGAFSMAVSSYNIASGTDSWSYSGTPLGANLVSGKSYVMTSRAVDRAGNTQAAFLVGISSLAFTWDTVPPESFLAQPVNGKAYMSSALDGLSALNGTASDASSALNKVQINLSYIDGPLTYYWDGAAFTDAITEAAAWQNASGTNIWNYSFDSAKWAAGKAYTLKVRAFDTAAPGGNEESPAKTITFSIDDTAPAAVDDLAASTGSIAGEVKLSWNTPGDDGDTGILNNATFYLQYSDDSGEAWAPGSAQIKISTTGLNPGTAVNYTIGGLYPNTTWYFRLWTNDDAGNLSALSNGAAAATLASPISGDYIYATPGNGDTSFLRYSVSGDTWTTRTSSFYGVSFGDQLLVYPGSGDYIYALRGNSFPDFMKYSISGNSWAAAAAAPGAVNYGASLVYPGNGLIYAFRGNGTNDFWTYSPGGDLWTSTTSAPGTVDYGGALVYPDTGDYIYAFRGFSSKTFWRYSINSYTWAAMQDAPGNVTWGGSLVYPGGGDYIYAFQGETSSAFWRYSISGNNWTAMASAPGGIGFGASLSYPGSGDYIYAMQGSGGTQKGFWRYSVSDNSWQTMSDVPRVVSTGGSLVYPASKAVIQGVFGSSATVGWPAMPVAPSSMSCAGYSLQASALSDFSAGVYSSSTVQVPLSTLTVTGLPGNSTFYFRVGALNAAGAANYVYAGSSVTQANTPAAMPFTAVSSYSLAANWGANGNSPDTVYNAQLASDPGFTSVIGSSQTVLTGAPFGGLAANTSYYLRVNAVNRAGSPTAWGETTVASTLIDPPASVYFDEVSSNSITASAYAPSPAFTGIENGISGINITTGTEYGVWGSTGNYWTTKAAMTTSREGAAGGVIGGKLYVIGGYNNTGGYYNANEEYDAAANSWAAKTDMPTARGYLGAGVIGGRLYAVGGWNGGTLNNNEEYDPQGNSWTTKAVVPTARYALAAGAVNGRLYAVGGYNGSTTFDKNEEYDPAADSWATRTVMPTPRREVVAGVISGKLYAVGGYAGAGPFNTNEEYDPQGNSWTAKAAMPTARYGIGVGVAGGKLYAVGGSDGSFTNINEEYDPEADAWFAKSPMPTARYELAVGAIGGRLYAVGGHLSAKLDTNEEYTPAVARKFPGLTPNTPYNFKAKARNQAGVETGEVTVTTYTLAAVALPESGEPFPAVYASSVVVNWSSGTASGGYNGPGAYYLVYVSTASDFSALKSSDVSGGLYLMFTGLSANTTYYFRAQAYNAGGYTDYSWLVLGSTLTNIETPTSVYVDEVTTNSITASAYAPSPAFTGLEKGVSGVNITTGAGYGLWNSTGNYWNTKAVNPAAIRAGFASGVIGHKLYLIGGYDGGVTYYNTNEEYDPVSDAWTAKAAMTTPRGSPAAGVIGDRLYVVGGSNGSYLNVTEEYDPVSNAWGGRAAMPTPRYALAAGAVNGKLYAIGGSNGAALNANEEYDPATDSWAAKTAMPTARSDVQAGAIGDRLYVVGGHDGGTYLNTNEEYDPEGNNWAGKAAMPTARYALSAGVAGGKLYAVGGKDTGYLGANEEYDPTVDAWSSKAAMPTARYCLAAGVINGKLYAVGGYNGAVLNVNEEYTPGTAKSFSGLLPNTLYTFKARARNQAGVETGESVAVSTYTLAVATLPVALPLFADVSSGVITVNWSSGTEAGGFNGNDALYRVQVATSADFYGTTSSSYTHALSLTTAGLTGSTSYYFRIQAYNSGGMTDYSWFTLGSTVTTLGQPGNVHGTAGATTIIDWSWDAVPGAVSYNVYRAYALTLLSNSGAPNLQEIFLSTNTAYGIRVAAVDANGEGPLSDSVTVYTMIEPPESVTVDAVFSASITASAYAPAFTNLGLGLSGVNLAIDTNAWTWAGWQAAPASTFTALTPNTLYRFKASARNADGVLTAETVEYSTWTLAVTPGAAATAYTSPSTWSVTANWLRGANPEFTTLYRVQAATDATFETITASSDTYNASAALYGLAANATYYARVAAINGNGVMTDYLSLSSTMTYIEAPAGVNFNEISSTSISAMAGPGPFTGLDAGLSGVNLAVDTNTWTWAGWRQNATSTFTALTPNTLYKFKAKARNAIGAETGETAEYSTHTLAAVALPESGEPFTAVYASSVTVTWSSGTASGGYNGPGAAYLIYASTASDFSALASSAATGDLQLALTGLSPLTTYYFRAQAYNTGGYTDYSWLTLGSTMSAIAPPGLADPSYTAVSTGALTAHWQDNGNPSGTNYSVELATAADFSSIAVSSLTADLQFAEKNLPANTAYYGRVAAVDQQGGYTGYLNIGSTATMIETPAGVFFHEITTMRVSASADGPAFTNLGVGQSDTGLEISTDTVTWTWAGWLAGERSTFTALTPNMPYFFRAKARNQAGVETAYSPAISTYTLATVSLPQGGTTVFSGVALTSAAVNWSSGTATAGFNGAGASYLIHASTAADFSGADDITTGLISVLSADLSPLYPNTTYYARAQAYNSANVTDNSWLTLGARSTLADAPDPQASEVLFTTVTVSWTPLPVAPSSAACEGYVVDASTAPDFSGVVLSSSTLSPLLATLAVGGLAADSTYYFRAGAYNWAGDPTHAPVFSTVTLDNVPPSAVNDLSAGAVAGDTVDLYWTSAGDNGTNAALPYGSRYIIQYSTYAVEWSTSAPAGLVTVSTGGVQPGETQHYALTGLSGNTTYYFRLWTTDEADNYGPASNEASTLMLPNPVASPEFLTVYATNLTIAWGTAGNLPGTQYFAEASADAAFTLSTLSTVTTASNYTFNNLIPNTVYFARVKTLGATGVDSEFVSFGSTATLANQPAGLQVASVFVTSVTVSWDANSNPEGTFYDIEISTDSFTTRNSSATTDQLSYTAAGLVPNSTYYFLAAGINSSGLKSTEVWAPTTITYAAAPARHTVSFTAVSASSVTVQWLANGNPGYTEYYVSVSTAADFTGPEAGAGAWAAATSIMVAPLNPYTTYHFRAKGRDFLGRETAYASLGSTLTLSGTDVIPPTVTNLQGGDDTWRGGAGGSYKVYFADYGSGLSKFQVRVTTAQSGAGTLIADWTDVVTNIVAQTYSSDWQLPPAVFQNIPENTPSYVSVRVYDNSANVAVSSDVFYVKRDVTLPAIANYAVSSGEWIAADPGPIYDVDFADALSGLRYIQYCASSQSGSASANVLGWTDIAAVSAAADYTPDWGVNFDALADAVTNYISVRAIDTAGNIRTVVDAFRILKNIKGPLVAITSPSTAYVSTITAVAGSATKRIDIAPVEGNELALMRAADARYWDGAGFNSAAQFWLAAAGVDAWSVDVSTFGLVENSSYTAVARSRDVNGKYSAVYATFTFTIDAAAPETCLSTPVAGTTIYAFTLVEGTAADPQPGAGISAVEISVQRIIDGKWWNFITSAWGEAVISSRATGGANWQFYPGEALRGNAVSGQSYFVTAQAKDAAQPANASPFGLAGSTFTILDAVPPGQVTQISASSGTSPGRILLSWIASGDDGPAVMLGPGSQFAIQYATYPSVALSTALAQVLVSTQNVMPGSTQYHHVTGLVPSVTYYLALWTQDDAGLWSDASPLASAVSGESLNDQITGHVRMPSGTGITGVLVEAFDMFDSAPLTVYTANDGLGAFAFMGIADGIYRIQATWVANDIASTVSKDQIPMGYADVDFVLSTEYELASISGTVPLGVKPAARTMGKTVSAAGETVELYQGSRRIAVTRPDALGNFSIRNLLPGTYTVHFPQNPGLKDVTITLKNGENAVVAPQGELLRKNSVYAYPNPARNMITFHLQSDVLTELRKAVSVFGIDGKLVAEIKENNAGWQSLAPGEYKFELNTSKLASGVYIYAVRVEAPATGSSKKMIGKFAIIK